MARCPYDESDRLHAAWHEGFEAHKLEIFENYRLLQQFKDQLALEVLKERILNRKLQAQLDSINASNDSQNEKIP